MRKGDRVFIAKHNEECSVLYGLVVGCTGTYLGKRNQYKGDPFAWVTWDGEVGKRINYVADCSKFEGTYGWYMEPKYLHVLKEDKKFNLKQILVFEKIREIDARHAKYLKEKNKK